VPLLVEFSLFRPQVKTRLQLASAAKSTEQSKLHFLWFRCSQKSKRDRLRSLRLLEWRSRWWTMNSEDLVSKNILAQCVVCRRRTAPVPMNWRQLLEPFLRGNGKAHVNAAL